MVNNIMIELPDSYSDISETLKISELILSDAVDNAKTLFHTLVLSSFDNTKVASRVVCLLDTSPSPRDGT